MAGALDSFVEKIVQYNGKEQAELRVRIKLPGSWFDGLVGEEKAQQYEAEAFEYVPSHRFPKSRHRSAQTTEAIKFLCKSDVHEDPQHAGFIMPVIEWNRYRHYTYKDNREMEVPYIRSIVRAPAPTAAAAAKEDEKPAVYSEFEYVSSGKHVVNSRDGSRKEVACEWWRCANKSGTCKHRVAFKVVAKATGKMLEHVKKCNPSAYTAIALKSSTSSLELDENGEVVARLSFKEMLPHHARYVVMTVLEWDHFRKCRSRWRKAYVKGLKRGADIPCRDTCIKLLRVIKELMASKLETVLLRVLSELGENAIGAQDDIWSMKNCRESYGCLRVSAIIKILGVLYDVNPLLAFRTFAASSHTGMVIKVWKEGTLKGWGLDAVKSISLWTEDGAANNIKSSKLLGVPYEVCAPHQVQRATLFALGMAGSTSKNRLAKDFISKMSKQSSSFHQSGNASKGLQNAQIARGIQASKVKSTEMANATRWTGIYRCAKKTRLLEPDIKIGLTGEADGVAIEPPADISMVEAGATSGSEGSDNEEVAEDADSDAEQVAANEVEGKKFPLAHRCLSSIEFKLASQLESVLLPSHETVVLMQNGSGVDPGTAHLLAKGAVTLAKSPKVILLGGSEGKETQKEVHEASLDKMFRTYRTIFSEQMNKRFSLEGHPGKHVLLCQKMNASIDTSETGMLFRNKPSVYQLMQGEYMNKLKVRYNHAFGNGRAQGSDADASPAPLRLQDMTTPATSATPAAAVNAAAAMLAVDARPDTTSAVAVPAPATGKPSSKRKLSILQSVAQFQVSPANNATAVEDQIANEISKFESLKLTAAQEKKYIAGGIFNLLAFYNEHAAILPIHTLVYRADVGSMKGASACVESVFSGVKRLLGDFAATMSPEILEMYVFVHYNWQYEFMRPTNEEIVKAYLKIYGTEALADDVDDSDTDSGNSDNDESDGEEEGVEA